jgi:hypothetical protein
MWRTGQESNLLTANRDLRLATWCFANQPTVQNLGASDDLLGYEPGGLTTALLCINWCPEKCSHLRLSLFRGALELSQLPRQNWYPEQELHLHKPA